MELYSLQKNGVLDGFPILVRFLLGVWNPRPCHPPFPSVEESWLASNGGGGGGGSATDAALLSETLERAITCDLWVSESSVL